MEPDAADGAAEHGERPYQLPHPFKLLLLAVAVFALTLAVTLSPAAEGTAQPGGATIGPKRQAELVRLVRHDCGSCHGLTLGGGLGPTLTPGALGRMSPDALAILILHGRHGTAMPGWRPILSDADAGWIARQLLSGFPDAR